MHHAKPALVVSRCLGFDACRYNGQMIPNGFLARLAPFVDLSLVCPEVEIGLGTPRDPIRLVGKEEGKERLVQPSTGLDLTEKMTDFRDGYLDGLSKVDGFVLKARSPSCGVTDAKVHGGPGKDMPSLRRAPGMFAAGVLDRFPFAAVEDEGRLTNFRIREHFLTRIFTLAEFRTIRSRPTMGKLVAFQARHKLLFMAVNQTKMRELGRLVANPEKRPAGEIVDDYGPLLARALERMPKYTSHINVLMHGLGYFKKKLSAREKAHFLDTLEVYREGKVPLSAVTMILASWIARFDEEYLASQSYFEPFPADLVEITDSGKGRGK
jgi:uncharacterized protein YbgA (DUF1722 family)/uncharacterized protein YbbK (DUF523 family)